MRVMASTRQTENKSLDPSVENKATGAPQPVIAEADLPKEGVLVTERGTADDEKVKFVIAHPVPKSLVKPDDEGTFEPGAKVTVPAYVADHLASIGAGRRA